MMGNVGYPKENNTFTILKIQCSVLDNAYEYI